MILAALGAAYVNHAFEGAMLLFLFSLSHTLQEMAIERSRSAISALMKLRPETALCKRGAETVLVKIEELLVGDIVIVRPGESIPVDGVVIEGTSSVNQASITGESLPVEKKPGDPLFAGTLNEQGGLEMRVTKLAHRIDPGQADRAGRKSAGPEGDHAALPGKGGAVVRARRHPLHRRADRRADLHSGRAVPVDAFTAP